MENLPMKQSKLNILKKMKLRFYQLRKYGEWFKDAPEYIRQDERIIKKMIKHVLQIQGFMIVSREEKIL